MEIRFQVIFPLPYIPFANTVIVVVVVVSICNGISVMMIFPLQLRYFRKSFLSHHFFYHSFLTVGMTFTLTTKKKKKHCREHLIWLFFLYVYIFVRFFQFEIICRLDTQSNCRQFKDILNRSSKVMNSFFTIIIRVLSLNLQNTKLNLYSFEMHWRSPNPSFTFQNIFIHYFHLK